MAEDKLNLEMTPEMIEEMTNGLEPGESAFVQRNLSNNGAAATFASVYSDEMDITIFEASDADSVLSSGGK